ncbi:hypothetical protein RyT2_10630 [Pseudolactococcus yaeyamensis]
MKIKNCFLLSAMLLLGITGIATRVEAKIVSTSSVPVIEQYDSGGSFYSGVMTINEYGQIIYNSDTIDEKYQKLIIDAADSWNKALDRKVFVTYKEIGAKADIGDRAVDKIDLEIVAGNANVVGFEPGAVAWRGFGEFKEILTFDRMYLDDACLVEGSSAYASAVSGIRHEMGHALGLGHDYGVVMFSNDDPNSRDAYNACMAELNQGILPTIPDFNILAVKNILNNLSSIYYNSGYANIPSKVIASARLGEANNAVIGATFFTKTVGFDRTATAPIQAINLSTNQSVAAHTLTAANTFDSTTQVTTLNGTEYYVVTNAAKTSHYAIKVSDTAPGTEFDFKGNYLNSKTVVSTTAIINRNYDAYKVNDNGLFPTKISTTTTQRLNVVGQSVPVKSVYTSTKGNDYYLVEINGDGYIINAVAFFLTGDAGSNPVVKIDFTDNFLNSKKDVATTAIINKCTQLMKSW